MQVVIEVAAIVVGLVIAVWAGSKMLREGGPTSNAGNAFGGFDVFDPGKERSEDDLKSQKNQTVVTPRADDDDQRPLRLDTGTNSARVRRPAPPPQPRADAGADVEPDES